MNISRRQSFLFAGLILALFFLTTYFLAKKNTVYPKDKPKEALATTISNELSVPPSDGSTQFALGEFHRSESKDGKLLWEVSAKQGIYHPTTHTAEVIAPIVTLFRDNGEKIEILCDKASLLLEGVSLSKAELVDNVRVSYNNPKVTLQSSMATFDRMEGIITSPSHVEINSEMIDVTGDSLVANVDSYVVTVNNNVKTVIRPSSKRRKL